MPQTISYEKDIEIYFEEVANLYAGAIKLCTLEHNKDFLTIKRKRIIWHTMNQI